MSKWPFGWLLLAWICANTPPGSVAISVVWAGEARSFSHQERLVAGVAELLTGEAAAGLLAKAAELPVREAPVAAPTEGSWKLGPLQTEAICEVLAPRVSAEGNGEGNLAGRSVSKEPPLLGPPRLG